MTLLLACPKCAAGRSSIGPEDDRWYCFTCGWRFGGPAPAPLMRDANPPTYAGSTRLENLRKGQRNQRNLERRIKREKECKMKPRSPFRLAVEAMEPETVLAFEHDDRGSKQRCHLTRVLQAIRVSLPNRVYWTTHDGGGLLLVACWERKD